MNMAGEDRKRLEFLLKVVAWKGEDLEDTVR
jgi:hypothetical protein